MAKICQIIQNPSNTAQFTKKLGASDVAGCFAFGVCCWFVGALGYQFGKRHGKQQVLSTQLTNHKGEKIQPEEVKLLYLEHESLKNEVATLIQERDISLNNLNLVKAEIQELKQNYNEVNSLNEALAKADPNDQSPVQVADMKVYAVGNQVFGYQFDVLIVSTTDKKLSPKLTLLNATSLVEIPLNPSEYNTKGMVSIKGKFEMPAGFVPNQLKLMLSIDGQNVVKFYNWQVQ